MSQQQDINTQVFAAKVVERKQQNKHYRDTSLDEIRQDSQRDLPTCRAFFAILGTQGYAALMESILGVGDKNALSFFDRVSPERGMLVVAAYATLKATNGADNGNPELTEYEALQAYNLYHSEKMNQHPDSPYKQDPKFNFGFNPDGSVTVDDLPTE